VLFTAEPFVMIYVAKRWDENRRLGDTGALGNQQDMNNDISNKDRGATELKSRVANV
jgi:hypothetical protein